VIRLDVHPAGENLTNTSRTLPTLVHARSAYAFYGQSPYVTTFHWLPQSRNRPLHPEEVLPTKDRLAQPSSWVTSFLLPCDSPGVGERVFGPMVTHYISLLGPYHQHAIGTFNTCSRGPTERSLIDTGGVYNLGGVGLPHTHSPTFPSSCLRFPLKAPLGLHFNQATTINQSFEFKGPMAATWSFDHSAIYHSLHLHLAIANDLSLVEGSQG
jgi:hypothetical protein